jgi:fatty acid desaturase
MSAAKNGGMRFPPEEGRPANRAPEALPTLVLVVAVLLVLVLFVFVLLVLVVLVVLLVLVVFGVVAHGPFLDEPAARWRIDFRTSVVTPEWKPATPSFT